MAIRVALHHRTEYHYDRLVALTPQVVRLRPAPHCRTPILSYSLKVSPPDHFLNWQQDPYSNYLARLVFPKPTREFSIEVDLVAEMTVINPFDFFIEESAQKYPFVYEPVLAKELLPFRESGPAGPLLGALVEEVRKSDVRMEDFLVDINRRLSQQIKYLVRMEPGVQTSEETLTVGSGSCRDTGWLLVQLLRQLGLAARFVSGYLIQLKPDFKPLEGPPGPETDFTDLHAWAEVYVPGAGWIGLDPTSGLLAGEGHIPLACAADPQSAAPISGSFTFNKELAKELGPCVPEFGFDMKVMRVEESPRVTKPYREEQWQEILDLGHQVDQRLRAGDVRLTMGGEPTFISIDDRDGEEWNFTAMSPNKRRLAGQLLGRLRDHFAPGALLHYGQGKWYPGESLPRWALSCYWRRDGASIWEDPELHADLSRNYGHDEEHARGFVETLADRLGVDSGHCMPGYEDVWYYLWRERRLPVNVDVLKNQLEDPEERRRLARVFEQGLKHVVGYALPLRRQDDASGWMSAPWSLRREHMYLTPGDSPMGFRLPLESLPWATPADILAFHEHDPFAPRAPLPPRHVLARDRRVAVHASVGGSGGRDRDEAPDRPTATVGRSVPGLIRTALCVEPREGRLNVFMPPQESLEDYLDLVAAVEDTAAALQLPVSIEGYPPPSDYRLNQLKVTPDPGVIEVNIHPAHSWDELVEQSTTLYEEAHKTRLGTEKFMVDGRHTGTGGGNHVVLGGPTPRGQPDPPQARPLAEPRGVLAQSSLAVVPLFGHVHRADEPGAAGGRCAERQPLRARDRISPDPRPRRLPPLAGRPRLPAPAGRRHGEHAPGRVLHRQALLSGRHRPAPGAARVAGPGDAPAFADESGPAALDPRLGRAVLGPALRPPAGALGDRAPRPLRAPALRAGGLPRCHRRDQKERPAACARVVRSALRISLPLLRRGELSRSRCRTAAGDRALARPG